VPTIGALLLTTRFVDHRPLQTFGIGFLPQWQEILGKGLGLGAGMVAFLLLGCFTVGYVRIGWTGTHGCLLLRDRWLILLLAAAATRN